MITVCALIVGLVISIVAKVWVVVGLFSLFLVGYLVMARIRMSRKTFERILPPG